VQNSKSRKDTALTRQNTQPSIAYAKPTRVLIYAAPGLVRDSLCSLIASFSFTSIVGVLPLCTCVLDEPSDSPDLVLLDTFNEAQNLALVLHLRQKFPLSRLVVIIDTLSQKQLAYLYGADDVLMRGSAGQEFKAIFLPRASQDPQNGQRPAEVRRMANASV
jgi:hypothetical protein